jgi:uncharacterized membrane protein YhaH (DUF805 family)
VAYVVVSSALTGNWGTVAGAILYFIWAFCVFCGVNGRSMFWMQLFMCCTVICAVSSFATVVGAWIIYSGANRACAGGDTGPAGGGRGGGAGGAPAAECEDGQAAPSVMSSSIVSTVFGLILTVLSCVLCVQAYHLTAKRSEYFVPLPPMALAPANGAYVVGAPAQPSSFAQPNPFLVASGDHRPPPTASAPPPAALVAPDVAAYYAARGQAPPAVVGAPHPSTSIAVL